jgi:hypothetical protein
MCQRRAIVDSPLRSRFGTWFLFWLYRTSAERSCRGPSRIRCISSAPIFPASSSVRLRVAAGAVCSPCGDWRNGRLTGVETHSQPVESRQQQHRTTQRRHTGGHAGCSALYSYVCRNDVSGWVRCRLPVRPPRLTVHSAALCQSAQAVRRDRGRHNARGKAGREFMCLSMCLSVPHSSPVHTSSSSLSLAAVRPSLLTPAVASPLSVLCCCVLPPRAF